MPFTSKLVNNNSTLYKIPPCIKFHTLPNWKKTTQSGKQTCMTRLPYLRKCKYNMGKKHHVRVPETAEQSSMASQVTILWLLRAKAELQKFCNLWKPSKRNIIDFTVAVPHVRLYSLNENAEKVTQGEQGPFYLNFSYPSGNPERLIP